VSCPAKSSICTTFRLCTDRQQSTEVGHQRSCCCIDDVLLEDRIHKKVMMEGHFPIHESSFVFGLPLCSVIVLQNKESYFSGVETISSPTAPTRVPLNKEGAAGIGRLETIATRVYIGAATAIRSQFQIQKTRVDNRTSIARGPNSENECVCTRANPVLLLALRRGRLIISSPTWFCTTGGCADASRLLNDSRCCNPFSHEHPAVFPSSITASVTWFLWHGSCILSTPIESIGTSKGNGEAKFSRGASSRSYGPSQSSSWPLRSSSSGHTDHNQTLHSRTCKRSMMFRSDRLGTYRPSKNTSLTPHRTCHHQLPLTEGWDQELGKRRKKGWHTSEPVPLQRHM
jgi:hypothetical protein